MKETEEDSFVCWCELCDLYGWHGSAPKNVTPEELNRRRKEIELLSRK